MVKMISKKKARIMIKFNKKTYYWKINKVRREMINNQKMIINKKMMILKISSWKFLKRMNNNKVQ